MITVAFARGVLPPCLWAVAFTLSALLACASQAEVPDWQQQAAGSVAVIRGELAAPGLHHEVRVQRDSWGVPHIYASDQHDLFFAQGWVAAQDRLFQMELWKRSGQGRLAEILGPSAVSRDVSARLLRYRGDSDAELRSYSEDTAQILQAFTSGINAYIDSLAHSAQPGLPLEFRLAGFLPEHWKPEDCLNRLAAYSMMNNASSELLHAQMVGALGAARATALFHFDPPIALDPAPGVDFAGLSPTLLANVVSSDRRIPFPATALHESNNWTVSGSLTASGAPLLANDPHRVIALPSLRYMVHLVAPGWNVIGAGEPALPGVAAGHNEQIAWGFTIFGLDQQDLYLETLNPDNPKLYKTAHGWTAMREERATIKVRGRPDVSATLRFTRHGPVMWQDGRRALALRWVGSEPGTAGYLGSLALDRAQNWQQFEAAMPRWKVPSENIVYADRAGNIGEHSTGLAPRRRNFSGLLPLPGQGGYEWAGFLPNDALPHSYNPAAGFIASANQRMIPQGYPYTVGFEWAEPTRFLRIQEVLSAARTSGHKLTVADMEGLQTDVVSLPARQLQPLLRAASRASNLPGDPPATAVDLLLNWDANLRADSAAAALFEVWAVQLRKAVTERAVPAAVRESIEPWPLQAVVQELAQPREPLFGSAPPRARDALLRATLQAAWQKLSTDFGPDPQQWSWGKLHKVYFRHALDAAPGLAALLDRGPVERSGDGDVVQSTAYKEGSFEQVSGASYREIFDLSNWDNSVGINVPGQSGQPAARHFDDLLPLWSAGRYFPVKYSRQAVDAVTTDTLILRPAHEDSSGTTPAPVAASDPWCRATPQPAFCRAIRGARASGWPAQSRSEVMAANGMVVTSQPLAAQAGLQVLMRGGNAIDAAVATAAVLSVTEPMMVGIASDLFAIVYSAKEHKAYALNASGTAPTGATIAHLNELGYHWNPANWGPSSGMPVGGILPVTVPGTPWGWQALLQRFGTLTFKELLEPAVQYAEHGFPVSERIASDWHLPNALPLKACCTQLDPDSVKVWYPNGQPPAPGEIFRNPDLARALRVLQQHGADGFYKGEIARAVVAKSRSIGGTLSPADLADYRGEWVEPARSRYRGYELLELPPPSQDWATNEMLNILQQCLPQWAPGQTLASLGPTNPQYWHILVEAKKLAYADLFRYNADPDFVSVPLAQLLSTDHAASLCSRFDAGHASTTGAPGQADMKGDTIVLSTADREGNMVSWVNSNFSGFGSGVTVPGYGFVLHNRGALFTLDPNSPNALAAHKRPFNTLSAGLLMRDGQPAMTVTLMGGDMQAQGHAQLLINMIDLGANPQAAADMARFRHTQVPNLLSLESPLYEAVGAALSELGHAVQPVSGADLGGVQVIQVITPESPARYYRGASDLRKDGQASGW